jgi:hypothetical protein
MDDRRIRTEKLEEILQDPGISKKTFRDVLERIKAIREVQK